MQSNYQWHTAADQIELASLLADEISTRLNSAIAEKGRAIIALSGGSTPKPLFEALAEADIDWSKVVITLVDERWVPPSHALSNQAFMYEFLLSKLPQSIRFVPLYQLAENVDSSLAGVLDTYCEVTASPPEQPAAFDVVVLGMGEDGHTASFFPDADNIADLVDPNNSQALLSCESPTTQVPRVTWSVPVLTNTSLLVLHITGQSKKVVFNEAALPGDRQELPIRSALFQPNTELQVYYAD